MGFVIGKSIVALLEYYGIHNMCSSYTSWLQLHIDGNYITDEGGKNSQLLSKNTVGFAICTIVLYLLYGYGRCIKMGIIL